MSEASSAPNASASRRCQGRAHSRSPEAFDATPAGSAGAPAVDTVTDFSTAQGDVLDLRDLLHPTNGTGAGSGNATNYIHFTTSGADTIVHLSSTGGFSGGYNASAEDQTIVLKNVTLAGGSDAGIIQNLLNSKNLIIGP